MKRLLNEATTIALFVEAVIVAEVNDFPVKLLVDNSPKLNSRVVSVNEVT